jgi:hypothetical protein
MEVSGQIHAVAALPLGKQPWSSLNRRLGGPQSRSGCCAKERNLLPQKLFDHPANDLGTVRVGYHDSPKSVATKLKSTIFLGGSILSNFAKKMLIKHTSIYYTFL